MSRGEKSGETKASGPRVTGIGGVFFQSVDPDKTRKWYADNLGIEMNAWGSAGFDSRNMDDPEKVTQLQWKPFKSGDPYFSPSTKPFMINYTVNDLEGLLEKLSKNGVKVLGEIARYDFGKFAHIMDADGNKIELWEPA